MARGAGRPDHVLKIVLDVPSRQTELAREARGGARLGGQDLHQMFSKRHRLIIVQGAISLVVAWPAMFWNHSGTL